MKGEIEVQKCESLLLSVSDQVARYDEVFSCDLGGGVCYVLLRDDLASLLEAMVVLKWRWFFGVG